MYYAYNIRIGPLDHRHISNKVNDVADALRIPEMFCQIAPPTPLDILVNRNTKWTKLIYPPLPPTTQIHTNPWTINPEQCLPLKYPPQFCYYTDGSFKPPKQINNGQWEREKVGYGIYNPFKNLKLAKRIPGLQNILRAYIFGHTPHSTTPYHNIPK